MSELDLLRASVVAARRRPAIGVRDVAAYLTTLGVRRRAPSVEALHELHAAHVARVPYETLWLHLGEQWGIRPADSFHRIAHRGRGGYCFHLNGALGELLSILGYRVTMVPAGVHNAPDEPAAPDGHLLLVVGDLPTDDHPDGRWYVDAGLGDGPRLPLPLRDGVDHQGTETWTMSALGDDAWRLGRPAGGSFDGVSFSLTPVGIEHFEARHAYHRTSPESGFARTPTAQRRHATGTDIMRGLVLTRTADGVVDVETFQRPQDWADALAAVFGLRPAVPAAAMTALWDRMIAAHEERAA